MNFMECLSKSIGGPDIDPDSSNTQTRSIADLFCVSINGAESVVMNKNSSWCLLYETRSYSDVPLMESLDDTLSAVAENNLFVPETLGNTTECNLLALTIIRGRKQRTNEFIYSSDESI
eukprot:379890_1